MPIFLDKLVLPFIVGAVIVLAFTNPMGFDRIQRITAGVALIFAGYFISHSLHKYREKSATPDQTVSRAQDTQKTLPELPKATPGKLCIAVTHLENDPNGDAERLIIEDLKEYSPVPVLRFDRTIVAADTKTGGGPDGMSQAVEILKETGASVLIWGSVLRHDNRSVIKLYWTAAASGSSSPRFERYTPTESLNLPGMFWGNLTSVLKVLVEGQLATENSVAQVEGGRRTAEAAFATVRDLLRLPDAKWSDNSRIALKIAFANSLSMVGVSSGATPSLEEARSIYQSVLIELGGDPHGAQWLNTKNGLGNVLTQIGEFEVTNIRLKEAIACYADAIKLCTPADGPGILAKLQSNRSYALSVLGKREQDITLLIESEAAANEALKYLDEVRQRTGWAHAHHNRGVSLEGQADLNKAGDLLPKALEAFQLALSAFSKEQTPSDWGREKYSIGNALLSLAYNGDAGQAQAAIVAYREALGVYTRERMPFWWAHVQGGIAGALELSNVRNAVELKKCVLIYDGILEIVDARKSPSYWVRTKASRGRLLAGIGWRTGDSVTIQSGLADLREALSSISGASSSTLAAEILSDVGNALSQLGTLTRNADNLRDSVACHQEALAIYAGYPASSRGVWEKSRLASSIRALAELELDPALLNDAISKYELAIAEFASRAEYRDAAGVRYNLGNALAILARLQPRTDALDRALVAYNGALEVYTREIDPIQWANIQMGLGNVLRALGGKKEDAAAHVSAARAYESALSVFTREGHPVNWAQCTIGLASTLQFAADTERAAASIQTAIGLYRSAALVYTESAFPMQWAAIQNDLGNALRRLWELDSRMVPTEEIFDAFQASIRKFNELGAVKSVETSRQNLELARASIRIRQFH